MTRLKEDGQDVYNARHLADEQHPEDLKIVIRSTHQIGGLRMVIADRFLTARQVCLYAYNPQLVEFTAEDFKGCRSYRDVMHVILERELPEEFEES